MPVVTKTRLSPVAATLFSRLPKRTVDAFRAELLGREVMHDVIRAAAFDLITCQDEGNDLRLYLVKIEAAVHEVTAHLIGES